MNERVNRLLSAVYRCPLAWLTGQSHPKLVSMLAVVLVLVSASAILESGHVFRPFDDVALSIAMLNIKDGRYNRTVDPNESSGPVAVVLISEKMFESKFDRRLPVDPTKLARIIEEIVKADPRRIAIDIDIAKGNNAITKDAETEPTPCGGDASNPLHVALCGALTVGIDVFGITYARQSKNGRETRNEHLRAICALRPPSDKAKHPPAIFQIVSSQLKTLQRSAIDIPYFTGQPPALGIAAACAGSSYSCRGFTGNEPNYCALIDQLEIDASLPGVDDDGRPAKTPGNNPAAHAFDLIQFRPAENQVRRLIIDSLVGLKAQAPFLHDKIVFLGLKSFANLDSVVTPVGLESGAVVHAAIANSMLMEKPLRPDLAIAIAVDFIIGLLFAALATCTYNRLARHREKAPSIVGTVGVLWLPMQLAFFSYIILLLMPLFLASGVWLNPLPMLLGLTAHAYWEARESAEHPHPGCGLLAPSKASNTAAAWVGDRIVGYMLRLAAIGAMAWGAYVVISH